MNFKRRTATALTFAALALAAGSTSAATLSFQEGVTPTVAYAMGATYIRSSGAGAGLNFDGDNDLELIAGPTVGDVIRTMLEFDVSAIPAADQVDSATLNLTTHATSAGIGGIETFNLHAYNFDLSETTATWNAPGTGDTTGGGTLGASLGLVNFDVTQSALNVTFGDSPAFRAAVGNALAGDGFLRLILVNNDEAIDGTHNFARFAADSSGTAGSRPELVIEHSTIPEPSSALLIALGGLALLRRRRK